MDIISRVVNMKINTKHFVRVLIHQVSFFGVIIEILNPIFVRL